MEPALIQELDHPPPSFTNEPERGTESDEVLIPPVPLKPENQNCAVDEWQFVIVAIATTGYNIHSDDICQMQLVPFKTTLELCGVNTVYPDKNFILLQANTMDSPLKMLMDGQN